MSVEKWVNKTYKKQNFIAEKDKFLIPTRVVRFSQPNLAFEMNPAKVKKYNIYYFIVTFSDYAAKKNKEISRE